MSLFGNDYNAWDDWNNDDHPLESLKPCPCCGGEAWLKDDGYEEPEIDSNGAYVGMDVNEPDCIWVECQSCGLQSLGAGTPEEAIARWNKRTNSVCQEQKSPCAACGYGGKHLDAPPCTNCPAYPKEEKNDPLTLKELREMDGQPVYVAPQSGRGYVADAAGWAKVNARNERCEAPNLNFYFCEYVTYWLAYRHPPKGAGE